MSTVMGLSVEHGSLRAVVARRGVIRWAASASYSSIEELRDAVCQLAAERPAGVLRVCLSLGDRESQLRLIDTLPYLSRTELLRSIRLAPRRFFLQNGAPLVFDADVSSRRWARHAGPAILVAASEPLVEALIDGAAASGMTVAAAAHASLWLLYSLGTALRLSERLGVEYIAACAAAVSAPPRLSLLPQTVAASRRSGELRLLRHWALACVAACVIASAAYTNSLLRQDHGAQTELARLAPALAVAQESERDLDQARAAVRFLELGAGAPTHRARLLAQLARALPDAAFLTSFRIDSLGHITIAGLAQRAAAVPPALERLGLGVASLDGSVTREVANGIEYDRFVAALRPAKAARP